MTQRVDGEAVLHLLAQNEQEVAKVYRHIAEDAKMGDIYFENMAKDEDNHHKAYMKLAEQAKADGGWVVDPDEYDFFRLRLERSLLNKPEELLDKAKKIRDKMEMFELAERIERETVEIVRELQDIIPRFAPEELKIIEKEEKAHLKKVTERIRDNFLAPRGL